MPTRVPTETTVDDPHPPPQRPGRGGVIACDEQDDEPVEVDRWRELAGSVLIAEGVSAVAEMSVLFVDSAVIADLNQEHLGASGPTDVLSFPIDDVPGIDRREAGFDPPDPTDPTTLVLVGDVVICPAVARRNAPTHAGTYDDEMALLVVHGVLHLLGMDHATDAERDRMQAREREYLDRFHR